MSKIQSSEDLQDLAELAYGHLYTSFMEKYGNDYYQTVKPLREYLDSLPAFNPEDLILMNLLPLKNNMQRSFVNFQIPV